MTSKSTPLSRINPTISRSQRCPTCSGAGIVEAGGFVKKDCTNCKGTGSIRIIENDIDFLLAKTTQHYQDAKEKIKRLDSKITDAEAEKLLDAELAPRKAGAVVALPREKPKPKDGKKYVKA
jgi:RecJ-like exonuclease